MSDDVTDNHLLIYIEHLKPVQEDMHARFKDLPNLEVFPWLVKPFAADIFVSKCDSAMQELPIDLQSKKEVRAIFNARGKADFWIKCSDRFPELQAKLKLLFLAFSSTYIVEQGFSKMLHIKKNIATDLT